MQISFDDDQWTSARAVCVVRLVSTADSRTEKLCVLLTVSNSRHCIVCTYLNVPYPAVVDVCGFSKEVNATLE